MALPQIISYLVILFYALSSSSAIVASLWQIIDTVCLATSGTLALVSPQAVICAVVIVVPVPGPWTRRTVVALVWGVWGCGTWVWESGMEVMKVLGGKECGDTLYPSLFNLPTLQFRIFAVLRLLNSFFISATPADTPPDRNTKSSNNITTISAVSGSSTPSTPLQKPVPKPNSTYPSPKAIATAPVTPQKIHPTAAQRSPGDGSFWHFNRTKEDIEMDMRRKYREPCPHSLSACDGGCDFIPRYPGTIINGTWPVFSYSFGPMICVRTDPKTGKRTSRLIFDCMEDEESVVWVEDREDDSGVELEVEEEEECDRKKEEMKKLEIQEGRKNSEQPTSDTSLVLRSNNISTNNLTTPAATKSQRPPQLHSPPAVPPHSPPYQDLESPPYSPPPPSSPPPVLPASPSPWRSMAPTPPAIGFPAQPCPDLYMDEQSALLRSVRPRGVGMRRRAHLHVARDRKIQRSARKIQKHKTEMCPCTAAPRRLAPRCRVVKVRRTSLHRLRTRSRIFKSAPTTTPISTPVTPQTSTYIPSPVTANILPPVNANDLAAPPEEPSQPTSASAGLVSISPESQIPSPESGLKNKRWWELGDAVKQVIIGGVGQMDMGKVMEWVYGKGQDKSARRGGGGRMRRKGVNLITDTKGRIVAGAVLAGRLDNRPKPKPRPFKPHQTRPRRTRPKITPPTIAINPFMFNPPPELPAIRCPAGSIAPTPIAPVTPIAPTAPIEPAPSRVIMEVSNDSLLMPPPPPPPLARAPTNEEFMDDAYESDDSFDEEFKASVLEERREAEAEKLKLHTRTTPNEENVGVGTVEKYNGGAVTIRRAQPSTPAVKQGSSQGSSQGTRGTKWTSPSAQLFAGMGISPPPPSSQQTPSPAAAITSRSPVGTIDTHPDPHSIFTFNSSPALTFPRSPSTPAPRPTNSASTLPSMNGGPGMAGEGQKEKKEAGGKMVYVEAGNGAGGHWERVDDNSVTPSPAPTSAPAPGGTTGRRVTKLTGANCINADSTDTHRIITTASGMKVATWLTPNSPPRTARNFASPFNPQPVSLPKLNFNPPNPSTPNNTFSFDLPAAGPKLAPLALLEPGVKVPDGMEALVAENPMLLQNLRSEAPTKPPVVGKGGLAVRQSKVGPQAVKERKERKKKLLEREDPDR